MSGIREIPCSLVIQTVRDLFISANTELNEDVLAAVKDAAASEDSPLGKYVLERISENADIARKEGLPLCQDTGFPLVFIELGQDVHISGGNFYDAIQEGVRRAYTEGYLRKSICDPLTRKNTGDNTPAVIHTDIVEGDRLRIRALPKGGGSENMSAVAMLLPGEGEKGVKEFVVEQVKKAGANPCPPVIVGVGLGGTIDQACLLAKKSHFRKIGERNPEPGLARTERELLDSLAELGIGPLGWGGKTTAFDIRIEAAPCHIASLPVAVNIQCHSARSKEAVL